MTDRLVDYYDQELVHLRRAAAEFAKAHPAQAGHLRLTGDAVEDPHVARLMEAFAYLSARVRLKLDDDFPELTEALLGVLYPHYLAPLPAVTILQFQPVEELAGAAVLAAGTELDSEPVDEERCRFRTCYPVTLWPVELRSARLGGRPIEAPANPAAQGAAAVLHLSFHWTAPQGGFGDLKPAALRLFLRGGPQQAWPLYDLLAGHVVSVAAASSPNDPAPVILGPEAVRPVGFEAAEAILPADPRAAPGYRLLTEYFAWPEKFLFFDIAGLDRACVGRGDRLDLFLYLDRAVPQLERDVGAGSFALGCAPAVNLFPLRAEPIPLDHRQVEHRIVADARRPRGLEIYRVDRVSASAPDGARVDYAPFYGRRRGAEGERFWHAVRRPGPATNPGTEVFLSVVDIGFDPDAPAGHVLSVDVTCLNRDLPARLPFGGGHPRMSPVLSAAAVKSVACLTPPSRTLRPSAFGQDRWRLISHLSLNHLSLADGTGSPEPLREALRLYDMRDTPETRALIDGLTGVEVRPGTARAPQPDTTALCRGLDVTIELDPRRFGGTSMLLFAGVLDRFLALHASINAFTRLAVRARDRTGIIKRWPARSGERILL